LLSQERYQPPPVKRVEIDKPGGVKRRPIGIPTVGDRVVQQATLHVVGPLFEQVFEDCSWGFRPGRGPKLAVAHVRHAIAQGDRWVAEFDIEGFFDNLSHARLVREFAKVVTDPEVVGLVRRWLEAGVVAEDGVRRTPATGTPQGSPISPLLATSTCTGWRRRRRQRGYGWSATATTWWSRRTGDGRPSGPTGWFAVCSTAWASG
jgi:RNA-directed DNA polymerase